MGANLAALRAGTIPKIIPIIIEVAEDPIKADRDKIGEKGKNKPTN